MNIRKVLKWTVITLLIVAAITFAIIFVLSRTQPEGGTVSQRIEKLNPFNGTQNGGTEPSVTPGDQVSGESPFTTTEPKAFRRISDGPVSGLTVFARPRVQNEEVLDPKTNKMVLRPTTTYQEVARYVNQETGYIYEAIVNPDAITERQLTATPVPRTEEIVWGTNGDTLAMRFADDRGIIQTFQARIPADPAVFACGADLMGLSADIKKGSKGAVVMDLQKFLAHVLGFTVKPDGSFGPGTEARVKEYQTLAQIAETGVVDEATRGSIIERCSQEKDKADEILRQPKELAGGLVAQNILRMVEKPDNTQFFYLTQEGTRGTGFIQGSDGSAITRVFDSPLSEWLAQWANKDMIALQTAASARANGYLYHLDPNTLLLKKILGPLPGLTALVSPDGAWALTSTSENDALQTQIRSLKTGSVTDLSRTTLPGDKCVWSSDSTQAYCAVPRDIPPADYPDQWYQGITRFSDTLWKISIPSGEAEQILDPNGTYDFINPRISPNGQNLYVIDKATGSLWVLNLAL